MENKKIVVIFFTIVIILTAIAVFIDYKIETPKKFNSGKSIESNKTKTDNSYQFQSKIRIKEEPEIKTKEVAQGKKSNITTIIFEEIFDVEDEDIFNLNEAYLGFIKKYDEAIYFKTDFTSIFEKKIGDKVSININKEDFSGFITYVKKTNSPYENTILYNFRIQPDINKNYIYFNIGGWKNLDTGNFYFEGDIDYRQVNGIKKYRYDVNEQIGIIIPYGKFDYYLTKDLGLTYD